MDDILGTVGGRERLFVLRGFAFVFYFLRSQKSSFPYSFCRSVVPKLGVNCSLGVI